jgi:hypothetical protein
VLELIALGVVIAIEPLPIIGFILVLGTDRGARNGAAFIVAWVLCLIVVIVGTLALTGGAPPRQGTAPANLVGVVYVALGAFLLGVAARVRQRPADVPRPQPSWMKRVDGMQAGGAALLGFLLQPWGLVAAGAAAVSQADVSNGLAVASLVLFAVLGTSVLLTMEIYTIRQPEAARAKLDALHGWLDRHRDQGIVILSASVGAWLVVQGLITLITQN